MLTGLFVTIAEMTLFGTLAILAVGLLLLLLDWLKAPKYMCSLMCLVAAVRLLCPVGIPMPVGLFRLSPVEKAVDLVQRAPESPVGDYEVHLQGDPDFERAVEAGVVPRDDNIINTPVVLTKPNSVAPAERAADKQIPALLWIWLAGFLGMAGYGVVTYWMLKHKISAAVKCPQLGENVYCSDQIQGPFVCGVIKPRIYLPLTIREDELDYILLHEQTHIRRKDHLIKIVYYLALCVHWFNPIVWNFQKLAAAEIEYACDEAVLKKMGTGIRADYSRSILNMAVSRKMIGSPLAFGENSPKERIQNILKYKKPTLAVIIAALVLCIVVAVICIASPKRETDTIEEVVYSNLQVQVEGERKNGDITARIITDCPEGEAGTEVYIRRNDEKKGNWLDDIQPGEWLNIGYQTIEHDGHGGPETYVALDMVSMDEYVSSFTLYRKGTVVQHNALYNSFMNMQLPSLLLNSSGEEKSTSPFPDAEEFLRVEIGEEGFRVYFVYQKDGKFYVEHPMDYRSQIPQETYDSLMGYLDKKELPNKSGNTPPEPVELTMDEKPPEISLGDINVLVKKAQGGEPLTWEDFEGYADNGDIGSGLYIVSYPVENEENLVLLVGAMKPGGPIGYAYLTDYSGAERQQIDLTKCTEQELENFIAAYRGNPAPVQTAEPSPSQTQSSSPAPSETPAKPDEPLTYFGAEVLEAYSYNPEGYTYHRINSKKQLETALKLLESGKTAAPKDKSEGGFLLLTSTGREEIYIDSQERELLTLCQNNNVAEPGLVQWLVFMNPEKITSLEVYPDIGDSWQFKTDERWALQQASNLLKTLPVSDKNVRTGEVNWGNPDTGGGPVLFLRFNTGVYYKLEISKDGIKIFSSDMSYYISYWWANEKNYEQIVMEMKQIYEQNPTYILSLPVKLDPEEIASVTASGSLGDSSFRIDTAESQKVKRICDILQSMRIYGMEKVLDEEMNFNTPGGDHFDVNISYKDGTRSYFHDFDKDLCILHEGSTYYGYQFTKENFASVYNALSNVS